MLPGNGCDKIKLKTAPRAQLNGNGAANMEENKEMLELLRKIERSNRIQTYSGYVRCALMLVCAVCMAALVVMVCRILPQINEILGQAKLAMTQIQTVLTNLE